MPGFIYGFPIDDDKEVCKIAMFLQDIYVSKTFLPGPSINRFRGNIVDLNINNEIVRMKVQVGSKALLSELPYHLFEKMNLQNGR